MNANELYEYGCKVFDATYKMLTDTPEMQRYLEVDRLFHVTPLRGHRENT